MPISKDPVGRKKKRTALLLKGLCCLLVVAAGALVLLATGERVQDATRAPSVLEAETAEPDQLAQGKSAVAEIAPPASTESAPTTPSSDTETAFEVVFFAPWGSAAGQLGRRVPEEGAPEGPKSLVVDSQGRVMILDQVNSRVVIVEDGQAVGEIGIPAVTFEDLRVDEDGKVILLDRLARRSIAIIDSNGNLLGELDLEGLGVSEGGGVTGLFQRRDGTWVEVEHRDLVQVADSEGRASDERRRVPGRFWDRAGSYLVARLDGPQAAVVGVRSAARPEPGARLLTRVEFPIRVLHLMALESDHSGMIFLAARLARFAERHPFEVLEERIEVVKLSREGAELGRVSLPVSPVALEQFRPFFVTADGTIYHLALDDHGATLRRVTL